MNVNSAVFYLYIRTVKIRSGLFNRSINFTVIFLKMTMSVPVVH